MSDRIVDYAQKVSQHVKELGFLLEKKKFLDGQARSIRREYERKRIGKKEYESLLASYSAQSSAEREKLEADILSGIYGSKKCLAAISLLLEGKQVPISLGIKVDSPLPFSFSVNIGRPEWRGAWGRFRELLRRLVGKVVREEAVLPGEKKGWTLPIIIKKEVVEKRVEVFPGKGDAGKGADKGIVIGAGLPGPGAVSKGAGIPVNIAKGASVNIAGAAPAKAGKGAPAIVEGVAAPQEIAAVEAEVPAVAVRREGFFSRLFQKKKGPGKDAYSGKAVLKPVVAAPPQPKPSLQAASEIGTFAMGGGISKKKGFFGGMFSKAKKERPAEAAPAAVAEEVAVNPRNIGLSKPQVEEQKPPDFKMPPPPKLEESIRLKDVTAPPKIGGDQFKGKEVPLRSEPNASPEVRFKPFKFSVGALLPKVPLPSLKLFSGQPKPLEGKPVQKIVPKVHLTRAKRSFTAPRRSLVFLSVEAPATYQALANRMVGWMVDRMPSVTQPLFWKIHESGTRILHRTYVSVAIFTSLIVGVLGAVFLLLYDPFYVLFAVPLALSVFGVYYALPFIVASNRRRNIEVNLPFAIHHMSAIAASGVTPYVMFRILTDFTEYGEVSVEATKIIRHVDMFGQDILLAVKEVTTESPSRKFSEFLNGITSTIETGGSLKEFLQLRARDAIFEYEIERKKYVEALSTYADFFTVILVAAPLFLVALLTIISMLGSDTKVLGLPLATFMDYSTYIVLPAVHVAFLGFLATSQPEV